MTWLGDTNLKLDDKSRDNLLVEREIIVKQVEKLVMAPCGPTQAAKNGRQEDLIALAKKIKNIDKKLGRNTG